MDIKKQLNTIFEAKEKQLESSGAAMVAIGSEINMMGEHPVGTVLYLGLPVTDKYIFLSNWLFADTYKIDQEMEALASGKAVNKMFIVQEPWMIESRIRSMQEYNELHMFESVECVVSVVLKKHKIPRKYKDKMIPDTMEVRLTRPLKTFKLKEFKISFKGVRTYDNLERLFYRAPPALFHSNYKSFIKPKIIKDLTTEAHRLADEAIQEYIKSLFKRTSKGNAVYSRKRMDYS